MTLQWQDDSAIASKVPSSAAVFQSKLVGGAFAGVDGTDQGVTLFDGKWASIGGKIKINNSYHTMIGIDDIGIFSTVISTVYDSVLQKSIDGVADFTDVLDFNGGNVSIRQLVDCGRHTVNDPQDALGDVERRVLFFFEYAADQTSRVWYSAQPVDSEAGDSGTWHDLFNAECPAIRHFHGGQYFEGKGLYVFTGDAGTASSECSIMFCSIDDIPSLIETPATWYDTNWQLGTGDRSGWSADHYSDYILWGASQGARTVDLVSSDNRYAYYIADRTPVSGSFTSQEINKVDLYDTTNSAAGTVSVIKTNVQNTGWLGGFSKNGIVYLSTIAYRNATNDGWQDGHIGYAQIWAIDPEDDSVSMVKQVPVDGVLLADAWSGLVSPLYEYGGTMFGQFTQDTIQGLFDSGDAFDQYRKTIYGSVVKQRIAATNLLTNNNFESGDLTGYRVDGSNLMVFTDGDTEFTYLDVITGLTSGATAVMNSIAATTGGDWGAGTWAGRVNILSTGAYVSSGLFTPGETVTAPGGKSATLAGFSMWEILPDPTGIKGGNIIRIAIQATGLVVSPSFSVTVPAAGSALSPASRELLKGSTANYSFKLYAPSISGTTLSKDTVQSAIQFYPTPGLNAIARRLLADARQDEWQEWNVPVTIDKSADITGFWRMTFIGNQKITQDAYTVYYLTDMQVVKGAIPNSQIKQVIVPKANSAIGSTNIQGAK